MLTTQQIKTDLYNKIIDQLTISADTLRIKILHDDDVYDQLKAYLERNRNSGMQLQLREANICLQKVRESILRYHSKLGLIIEISKKIGNNVDNFSIKDFEDMIDDFYMVKTHIPKKKSQ